MTDQDDSPVPDDLARAAPGIYVSESAPEMVWIKVEEILEARGHEPEDALIGSTATSLIDM